MEIKNAKYNKNDFGENCSINCTIDGNDWSVPIDLSNTFYVEIKKQVDAGTLTIKDAD